MKHITEASDEEILQVIWHATAKFMRASDSRNLVLHLREQFDFAPSPLPAEGVAELIEKMQRMSSAVYLAADESVARDISETLKLAIAALSAAQSPTPSDEELLRAYHGDDQHNHLAGTDHAARLRAVAALTTTEGQNND